MVSIRELRKGNIVRCLTRLPIGFNSPKLPHSEIVELRLDWVETNEGFYKYKDIDPIPLTEDILINSGGKKEKENQIVFHTGANIDIVLIKNNAQFFLGNSKKRYSVAIESLHHFQNLYFVLTQREISITL